MTSRLSLRLRRFTLRCLLGMAVAAPGIADAAPLDQAYRNATPCEFELADTEELCGWIGIETSEQADFTQPLCTHDSAPVPRIATLTRTPRLSPAIMIAKPTVSTFSDGDAIPTVAAIAAAACARAGVSVEQMAEPFALVGPFVPGTPQATESIASVATLQSWWKEAYDEAQKIADSDAEIARIDSEIEALAGDEPLDIESYREFGPSRLVESFPAIESLTPSLTVEITDEVVSGVEVAPLDFLVGSSAVVATLEEGYLPYDLGARDVQVWSLFPSATQPFCVRGRMDGLDADPMWQEFDQVVSVQGSADCLLNQLVWEVSGWMEGNSSWLASFKPRAVGNQVAELAIRSNRMVSSAAASVASQFPEPAQPASVGSEEVAEQEEAPSPAGGALLARAGAIEVPSDVPTDVLSEAHVEIARVPMEVNLR
ncbi:MAG: hypothetical protein AB8B91_17810 [Rubripirellula sp.]